MKSEGATPRVPRMSFDQTVGCMGPTGHWRRLFVVPVVSSILSVIVSAVPQTGQSKEPLTTGAKSLSQQLLSLEPLLAQRHLATPEAALEDVCVAYRDLFGYLDETTDRANRDAWLEYIDVPQEILEGAFASSSQGSSPLPSVSSIDAVRWRMARNLPGLEREPLLRFRQSVRRLAARLSIWQRRGREKIAGTALRRLASFFETGQFPTGSEEVAELNRYLWYLDATGMLPEATELIRREMGQPNVRIVVDESFLGEAYRQPVFNEGPSEEWILGTRVISDTRLCGDVTMELLPSPHAVKLQLVLKADFFSDGTGYNRKVRIFNEGRGKVHATRVLELSDTGLLAGPVDVVANLDTQIKGISHHSQLVRKIASRRASEQKPAANAIATRRLAGRVQEQFQQETTTRLATADGERLRSINLLLRRLDVSPVASHWSSTEDTLELTLHAASPTQVTTSLPPPRLTGDKKVVLQIHQSVIENTATEVLGERLLNEKDFDEFGKTLFASGLIPLETRLSEEKRGADTEEKTSRPLSVEFLGVSPIVFEVHRGLIRTAVRGFFSTQGSRDRSLLEIAATYRFEQHEVEGPSLLRVGETSVTFLDESGKPKRGLFLGGVGNVVKQRASQLLPATLPLPPLTWPRNGETPPLGWPGNASHGQPIASGQLELRVEELIAEDGWITAYLR